MIRKDKIIILIFFSVLLVIAIVILLTEEKDAVGENETLEPLRNSVYVKTADSVSMEMLHSDYWIEKQKYPDRVVMSQMDIDIWNQEFLNYGKTSRLSFVRFLEERYVVLGEDVYNQILGMYEEPRENMYDKNGTKLEADFWKRLFDNRNLDRIINEQEIKYAYTVKRADIRALPYEGLVTNENNNNYFCQLQVSSILMNEPVIILHESMDEEWYFIITRYCSGWIEKENVGICPTFEQWMSAMNIDEFLIVTGNKEILDVDMEHLEASELVLYMGTKLELVEYEQYMATGEQEATELIGNGRTPFECYIVKIPVRDCDGMLIYRYAFVPISRDVHIGYVPYTMRNLISQMFKVNGDRYGWGGMYNARDCSQYIMDIYSVFGLYFARNSAAQAAMPFNGFDLDGMNDKEKMKILGDTPSGSILYFQGHVMMYLGEVGGEYYVISETARIMQEDWQGQFEDGILNVHSCMITPLSVRRPNGNTWLSELSVIKCIK